MTQGGGGAERRKQRRVPMRLPVRVQGREADGTTWEEMSSCEDASAGGVGLRLKRSVVLGQVLHLSLPLPQRFRQYDLTDPSYRDLHARPQRRAPRPAAGCASASSSSGSTRRAGRTRCPGELFLMPGDPTPVERRKFPRHVARLSLKLEAEQAPGGVAVEERTMAEDISQRGAQVRATTLPVVKGAILQVRGDRRRLQDAGRGAQHLDRRGRAASPQPPLPRLPHAGAAAARRGRRREAGG